MTTVSTISLCRNILVLSFVVGTAPGCAPSLQMLQNLTKGYDKKARPFSSGGATNVSIQIVLIALGPISEKNQNMKSDIFLRQWWHDERLNVSAKTMSFNVAPSDYFWVPDTFVSNARVTDSHETFTKSALTRIGPNGAVYGSMRFTILCHCKMNLRSFPHDVQKCSIDLEPYAFSGNEIALFWKDTSEPIEALDLSISGYEVASIVGDREVTLYLEAPYIRLRAIITLKRSFPFYLYHVYIPGALLVVLSFTTFFIPPSAIPARVTLIVTNFLSTLFIFGGTSSLIPKKPYITAMEIYLLTNIVFIILVMIEYIFVLQLKALRNKRFKKSTITSRTCNSFEMVDKAGRPAELNPSPKITNLSSTGNILDTISKIIFPLSYMLCLITYFSIYL